MFSHSVIIHVIRIILVSNKALSVARDVGTALSHPPSIY